MAGGGGEYSRGFWRCPNRSPAAAPRGVIMAAGALDWRCRMRPGCLPGRGRPSRAKGPRPASPRRWPWGSKRLPPLTPAWGARDEGLSSGEAESLLARTEKDWRKRRPLIDATAAAIILQDYLDGQARS